MSKIKRFEDIEAWQKARELNEDVYNVTGNFSLFKKTEVVSKMIQGFMNYLRAQQLPNF